VVYDQTLGKYSILPHIKAEDEDEWTSFEADNGPWSAAGPSSNFRIGFGDYFDCDSLPEFGISVMAWSETAGNNPGSHGCALWTGGSGRTIEWVRSRMRPTA
jgi:hypothetical protein